MNISDKTKLLESFLLDSVDNMQAAIIQHLADDKNKSEREFLLKLYRDLQDMEIKIISSKEGQ